MSAVHEVFALHEQHGTSKHGHFRVPRHEVDNDRIRYRDVSLIFRPPKASNLY